MATSYSPKIITDGLVLCLDAANPKSYPGSGDIWFDLSGNGYNATRTNIGGYGGQVVYNTAGYFDFSVNSPATTAGALAGNGFTMSDVVVPTTGGFTLSAFIRRNTSVKGLGDRETIFSNAPSGNGWRFQILSGGALYYLIGSSVGFQEGSLGGNTLLDRNWHMATIVYDRAADLGSYKVYGYIDGIASGNVTISAGAGGNTAFTANLPGIGYGGCCDVFAGDISQLHAYSRVLTPSEVLQNYNSLKVRFGL